MPVSLPQKKGDPVIVRLAMSIRVRVPPSRELGALRPAFQKDGTVTAGNASGINDGAAARVVAAWRGTLRR